MSHAAAFIKPITIYNGSYSDCRNADIIITGIEDFCALKSISPINREEVDYRVRNAAYAIISRKGATHYAISLAVRRICESILRDEHSILTVSGLVNGTYGINNCCLSLPTVVKAKGRADVLVLPLADEEEKSLRQSAKVLQEIISKLGL